MERGTTVLPTRRTSIITDPPNGRLPALTAEVEAWMASPEARRLAAVRGGNLPTDTWEQLDGGDRCLWYRGIPSFPTAYNNHYQIVQNPDFVAILQEHIHDVRFIALDGRPHIDSAIRQFAGDSRGHWEGDTLVVETTHFNRHAFIRNFNANLSEESARDRALHAARTRHARLRVHGDRSEDMDETVERIPADGARRGTGVRVRLPRRELRAPEHAGGVARAGRGPVATMRHPTPIDPSAHAVYAPDKMGKSTLFRSDRVMVGLNAFEPGQEHALHAHAGMDKVYHVLEGGRAVPSRRRGGADADRDVARRSGGCATRDSQHGRRAAARARRARARTGMTGSAAAARTNVGAAASV